MVTERGQSSNLRYSRNVCLESPCENEAQVLPPGGLLDVVRSRPRSHLNSIVHGDDVRIASSTEREATMPRYFELPEPQPGVSPHSLRQNVNFPLMDRGLGFHINVTRTMPMPESPLQGCSHTGPRLHGPVHGGTK